MFAELVARAKDLLEVWSHLSRDALHVHIGLIVFLALVVLIRHPRRLWLALAALLGVCLINEVADLTWQFRHGETLRWLGSAKDIVNTMAWPAVWAVFGARIRKMR